MFAVSTVATIPTAWWIGNESQIVLWPGINDAFGRIYGFW